MGKGYCASRARYSYREQFETPQEILTSLASPPPSCENVSMQKTSTKRTLELVSELEKRGLEVKLEHWDGHKHVDIFIPAVGMYIEIDGLPHYVNSAQIIRDLQRDHFSNSEGFFTKHIPNELVENHLSAVADAIADVVKRRGIMARSEISKPTP